MKKSKFVMEPDEPEVVETKEEDSEIFTEFESVETQEGGKFKLDNQRLLLTYKSHIDKVNLTLFLKNKRPLTFKKCYIAWENGIGDTVTPYEHTHVCVDFGDRYQSKTPKCLDFEDIHPHISKIINIKKWKCACKYITKEDTSVILDKCDVLTKEDNMGIVEKIWVKKTLADAVKGCLEPGHVLGTIAAYKCKPKYVPEPRIKFDDFYHWQNEEFGICFLKPTGRKLRWLCEEDGNVGKTQFALFMAKKFPKKCIYISNIGKVSDFCMNVKKHQEEGWDGSCMFINLSRSHEDRDVIYNVCEIILDGEATCTKYEGGQIFIEPCHVFVMANFLPKIGALSGDRWIIKEVKLTKDEKILRDNPVSEEDLEGEVSQQEYRDYMKRVSLYARGLADSYDKKPEG